MVQLPPGWQLQERALSEPLVIEPASGGAGCYYNILRDNQLQAYYQYVYAAPRRP